MKVDSVSIRIIGSDQKPKGLQGCLGGDFVEVNPGEELVVEVRSDCTDGIKARVVIDGTDQGLQQLAGRSSCRFPWKPDSHPNGRIDVVFYPVDDTDYPLGTETFCYRSEICPIVAKKLPQLATILMVDGKNIKPVVCEEGAYFYAKPGQQFELFMVNVRAEPVQLGVTLDRTDEIPWTIAPKSSDVFKGTFFANDPRARVGRIKIRLVDEIKGCIRQINVPDIKICYLAEGTVCPLESFVNKLTDLAGALASYRVLSEAASPHRGFNPFMFPEKPKPGRGSKGKTKVDA